LGSYDPIKQPWEVRINQDRYSHWVSLGAQPTDTVKSLIKRAS
jgi:small subunit ribosomal protein S16